MRKVLALLVATAVMLSMTTGIAFAADNENEILIPAEVLSNAKITKESDSLITLTSKSTSVVRSTRATSGGDLYATDVDVVALLVSEPAETEEVYQDLLAAGDEASSYKTKSNSVAGLTIHSTVYYTIQESAGHEWYHLEEIDGGNNKPNPNSNVIGSGFVIGSQSVTYGVQGKNLEGQSVYGERATVDLNSKDDYFFIEVDDSWPTIATFNGLLGAYYSVDVVNKRDGSHILIELSNNPIDSIDFPDIWPRA